MVQSAGSSSVSRPTAVSTENSETASSVLNARTWSTSGLMSRGCRDSSRATITSLLSRTSRTSQKTTLKANSTRP